MSVSVSCAEGLAPSAQYRALALIAALQRRAGVSWSTEQPSTAALTLLSADDQLALLRATGDTAALDESQPAPKQPNTQALRHVWMATLGMLDHALPADSVGVLLDGAPASYDVAVRSGLERIFAFGPPQLGDLGAGLHALPRAVDPLFLAPPKARDPQAQPVLVGLCVCGEESALIEAASRAAPQALLHLELLCPNRRVDVSGAQTKRWGAIGPAARYALWQRAERCVAHDCIDVDNDAFCDEAQAMGVAIYRASSFALVQNTDRSKAEGSAPSASRAVHTWVDFAHVADLLLRAPEADEKIALRTPARPHARIVLAKSFRALAESAGLADATRDYAVVVCGDKAVDEEGSGRLAGRFGYANVFANLAAHAGLATTLMQQSIMPRIERQRFEPTYITGAMEDEGLLHGAMAWLQQRDERVLHVVFAPGRPLQTERLARRFAATSAPNAPLLRVVLDAKVPHAQERISGATIGVEIAGRDLARAMTHGLSAGGRALFWPRLQGSSSEQRTILPTQPGWLPRADADQRVVQACQPKLKGDDVRQALQHDEVDAFFLPGGPFIDGVVTARNAWAHFGVPVVGVLHSIHGLSISMQLWQQQSLSPLSAFDGFISPTECGKEALLKQWQAVSSMRPASAAPVAAPVIDVVPYGIHTAFYGGRDRLASRMAAGIAADALLFVQVGRMHRTEKGDLAPLLLAFREVVAAHSQAFLVLVGKPHSPEEVERTRALVERLGLGDSVDIREKVSAEEKAQLLCAADAFVSVSDNVQETYGLVLLEAMAAGTPVIAPGLERLS